MPTAPAPAAPPMAMGMAMRAEEVPVLEDLSHPYLQRLQRDLLAGWHYPDLEVESAPAMACLRIDADGDVVETELRDSSGQATIDDSIEQAMLELRLHRHNAPEPVPDELLETVPASWVCVRFRSDPE